MSEEVKTTEETLYCECCGCVIDDDDYTEWNGQIICSDCLENHTTTCECCGERIWDEDVYGDNDITPPLKKKVTCAYFSVSAIRT